MHTDEMVSDRALERIIGCAFTVANTLGFGFVEKVYANALARELRKHGFAVEQQRAVAVRYDGVVAQCINHLRATGLHLCLLINFGRLRLQVKRFMV
jgi:PD-(D/E)XK nuclease superfamily